MAVDLRVSIISGRLSAALEYSHFSINDPSSHLRESFLTPPGPRNTQGGTRKRRLFHRELGLRFQNAGTLEEGSLRCEKKHPGPRYNQRIEWYTSIPGQKDTDSPSKEYGYRITWLDTVLPRNGQLPLTVQEYFRSRETICVFAIGMQRLAIFILKPLSPVVGGLIWMNGRTWFQTAYSATGGSSQSAVKSHSHPQPHKV